MSKRAFTILTVTAAVLIIGIAAGIMRLYSGQGNGEERETDFIEDHPLLKAVPSDAAIVLCAKDFGHINTLLDDSTAVFREITSCRFDRIASSRFNSLRRAPAIISVHYSKDMPPLLAVEAGKAAADTTEDVRNLLDAAEAGGLSCRIHAGTVFISPSETIISSAIRHIDEGTGVLAARGFAEIASRMSGDDVLFLSHSYASYIIDAYLGKKHRQTKEFVKGLAVWTALSLDRHNGKGVTMHGKMLYGDEQSYYLNIITKAAGNQVKVAEVVPANVEFIADIPVKDISGYFKAYRKYLDSKNGLDSYEAELSAQKKANGKSAEEWAASLKLQEIAVADLPFGEGRRKVVLFRPGVKNFSLPENSDFSSCASTLFGKLFTAETGSVSAVVNGWIVTGPADCMEEYSKESFLATTLSSRLDSEGLSERIPQKGCGFWAYHSLSEDADLIGVNFSPMMAKGCRNILKGAEYVPAFLSAVSDGKRLDLEMNVDRIAAPMGVLDAAGKGGNTVAVPEGPFKVRNCATGKVNTFYQNSHLSICLQDENGKDQWGVPFKEPICGYVQEIDYFNNGKIQYLFAAGSQLYLIDRLGRFVSGFPVQTGKKIVAGPVVYDFTGAKGYTAMVLHEDNTVGFYDLHGRTVSGWNGITSDETIVLVPELLEGEGQRYWVVRTAARAMVFPFNGGEPLVKGEGSRTIRPDSKITITAKGFSAGCVDGKERTFKPEKQK